MMVDLTLATSHGKKQRRVAEKEVHVPQDDGGFDTGNIIGRLLY